ncbi:MAG: alpha/beta hydrolase, partial [Bacteroidota bacterium]
VIRHADAEPVTVQTVHPETDDSVFVTIDGDAFRRGIQGYTRGTRWRFAMPAWPRDLMRVIEGEYEGVARRWLRSRMNPGLDDAAFYAIECASGISDARRAVYAADEEAKLLGSPLAFNELVCENRLGDMGDELRAPFTSDVPLVMIQGDWDTSTPYENALELAGYFTDHRLVTVAGGSHGAQREANEEVPGFRDEVLRWMRTGSYEHLPGRVELKPVPWE